MLNKEKFPPLKCDSQDLIYLDFVRFIASFMIVISHLAPNFPLYLQNKWFVVGLSDFSFAVDLFFIISGFVISYIYGAKIITGADYKDFLKKRFARLLPLHWLTFLGFLAIGCSYYLGFFTPNRAEAFNPVCIIPHIFLTHAFYTCPTTAFNSVSWSVSAEMGLYIIFPLLFWLAGKTKTALISILIVMILLHLASQNTQKYWTYWTFYYGFLRSLPSFLLGIIAYNYRHLIIKIPQAHSLLIVSIIAFISASFIKVSPYIMLFLAYLVAVSAIAASSQKINPIIRKLAPLGQLTYSLYLWHPLYQVIVISFIGVKIFHFSDNMMILWIFIGIFVLPFISYISYQFFEKPTRRWLLKL